MVSALNVPWNRSLRSALIRVSRVSIIEVSVGRVISGRSPFGVLLLRGGLQIRTGGDLGRYGRPVLPDPAPVREADILLLESTYGDRRHEADDGGERLGRIVTETAQRGGKLIIPSFAIGRGRSVGTSFSNASGLGPRSRTAH